MAAASLDTSLNSALTCTVCLDLYKDPRTLPCQHIFCLVCLKGLVKADTSLTCPVCRDTSNIGPRGASSLPKSLLAADLVGNLHERSRRPLPAPRSGTGVQSIVNSCPKHPKEELSLFCKKEGVLICLQCLAQGHKKHKFATVKDAAAERRISLYKCLSDMTTLSGAYDTAHDELQEIISVCHKEKDTISQKISSKVDSLCNLIRKQGEDLLRNVDEIYAKEMEPFFIGKTIVSRTRDEIKGTCQRGENAIKNESDSKFIENQPRLCAELIKLKKETILPPSTVKGFKVVFVPKVVKSFDVEPATAALRRKVSPKKAYTTTTTENSSDNLTGKLVISRPSSLMSWIDGASNAVPFTRIQRPRSIGDMLNTLGHKQQNRTPLPAAGRSENNPVARARVNTNPTIPRSRSLSTVRSTQDMYNRHDYRDTKNDTSQVPIEQFIAAYNETRSSHETSGSPPTTPNAPQPDE